MDGAGVLALVMPTYLHTYLTVYKDVFLAFHVYATIVPEHQEAIDHFLKIYRKASKPVNIYRNEGTSYIGVTT